MDNSFNECITLCSFDKIYSQNIRPKIKELDVFLKCNHAPYGIDEVSALLGMERSDIESILGSSPIDQISTVDFFNLIVHSSNYICKLIQRQWRYISCSTYTPEMISYIYELNDTKVKAAFQELGYEYVYDYQLPEVFEKIYTPIFTMANINETK